MSTYYMLNIFLFKVYKLNLHSRKTTRHIFQRYLKVLANVPTALKWLVGEGRGAGGGNGNGRQSPYKARTWPYVEQ